MCSKKWWKKTHADISSKYSRKMVHQKKKKGVPKMLPWNGKSVIKETRKNKYKSQTKQCDDINNRQKRNCKKIHAQRKIGGKLKTKKRADIQCTTQIKKCEMC